MVDEIAEEKRKAREQKLKDKPLAILPDVTKFDKVFILPVFMKPGKHTYMVKYKDTEEKK